MFLDVLERSGFYPWLTKQFGSILTSYHQDRCQEIKLFFVSSIFSGFYVPLRNLPVKGLNEEYICSADLFWFMAYRRQNVILKVHLFWFLLTKQVC